MFDPIIASLPAFASYFVAAIGLLLVFCAIYAFFTPYREFQLIREGNEAAAVALGGAVIGFALPLAVTVAVNHSLEAMLGWGVVAGIVQLLVFVSARLLLPGINDSIARGRLAPGIFVALLSVAVGVLNAGCLI